MSSNRRNNKNVKAWYIHMKNWLKMEKVTNDEERFQFILAGTVEEATQIVSDKYVEANRILYLKEYHLNEDERFRELKTLLIMPNESVLEFNDRYLNYYYQLSTENKAKLSVYDYENSICTNEEDKTIEAACKIAKKVERIKLGSRPIQKVKKFNHNNISNNYPFRSNNFNSNFNNYKNINNNTLNRMNNTKVPRNINNTPNNNGLNSVGDITRDLENLHIKVCYWCHEPGHIIMLTVNNQNANYNDYDENNIANVCLNNDYSNIYDNNYNEDYDNDNFNNYDNNDYNNYYNNINNNKQFYFENDKNNEYNGGNVVVSCYDNHNNLEEIIAAKLRNITNNYDKTSNNNSQTTPQNKIFNNINNISNPIQNNSSTDNIINNKQIIKSTRRISKKALNNNIKIDNNNENKNGKAEDHNKAQQRKSIKNNINDNDSSNKINKMM
ncbi:hypothetical protein U3516DRAFT_765906 [Neocallimastix sp. 'constans']